MNMKTKKTKPPRIIDKRKVAIVCVAIVLVLLFLNVGIRMNPFVSGGCFSFTFDKLPMLLANKAVIRVGDDSYVITDSRLVNEITSETICATHTDLSYPKTDRWIDIYCGNKLIRSMRWDDLHDGIIVYNVHDDSGMLHWLFPSYGGDGIVYPSEELISQLNEIINAG